MEFAVALASSTDSWKVVKRAEELGFSASWFYDTQLLNPDVFICMALAAQNTSRIRLGTGVLIPSNRIEPVTANALATLNKLAPGRIEFGVGTGFTGRRTMGLPAIRLQDMRRYVERVMALLQGDTVEWDFEQRQRKIRFLNPDLGLINIDDPVALHVSAMGPRARQLTASMGAGWLNFGADDAAVTGQLQQMQRAWDQAGHPAGSLHSTLFFLGAVLTGDGERDKHALMTQAAPWTAVNLHNLLDRDATPVDLPAPTQALLARYREHHARYAPADAKYLTNHRGHLMFLRDEERDLITPELARATTMSGTQDELVARLRALSVAGYNQFAVQIVPGQEDAIEAWAEVFRRV